MPSSLENSWNRVKLPSAPGTFATAILPTVVMAHISVIGTGYPSAQEIYEVVSRTYAEKSGVKVQYTSGAREIDEAIQQLLRNALIGTELPDVPFFSGNSTRLLAERKLAVPLNAMIAADAGWSASFSPSVGKVGRVGEETYGVAFSWLFLVESFGGTMMSADDSAITFGGPAGLEAAGLLKRFGEAGQAGSDMTRDQRRRAFRAGAVGVMVGMSSLVSGYETAVRRHVRRTLHAAAAGRERHGAGGGRARAADPRRHQKRLRPRSRICASPRASCSPATRSSPANSSRPRSTSAIWRSARPPTIWAVCATVGSRASRSPSSTSTSCATSSASTPTSRRSPIPYSRSAESCARAASSTDSGWTARKRQSRSKSRGGSWPGYVALGKPGLAQPAEP